MGSLVCNGCSQLVFFKDKQLTELKIHMINIHNFVNKVNSVINLAFLNDAEEAHLDQLVQPRIKHFLETDNLHPNDVNVFKSVSSVEIEESDIPDIDESISDDEDDELGEDELEEAQDMLIEDKQLEHRLLEKLSRSVVGNTVGKGQKISGEEKPTELNEKYLENLMDKLRDDEDEDSDVDVKGGEEDNDSDTNPFSPEKTNSSEKTTNHQDEIQHHPETAKYTKNRPFDELDLQMSTPTSLVKRELVSSTQKAKVKIERTVVVDVIVEEVETKTEKRMEESRGSLKRENQEDSSPSDFCRLCYCRSLDFSSSFQILIFVHF